ncbi:unnamed protein product [Prorocentrum cordatum]|uniref:Methyltransferase domain-containing protein n=1 Tax=Prorocentrum cordatum TaxID=2364126 RepID=A0ABN9Y948_9DINO|nr:unnamed protein product [Polarella glacialis]
MVWEAPISCHRRLVARFLEHDRATWARLLRPEYHFFHSRVKTVHKELSESLAILNALGSRLEHFRHVVDLCCGKSLTSAILAARRPSVQITAVDIVSPDTVPHYSEAGVSSVEYLQMDIMSDQFPAALARRAAEAGGDTAVLGVHCCGRLSMRAVELFRDMEEVRACVLMPCCGANATSAPSAMAHHYGVGLSDPEFYQKWCDYLQADLEGVPGATVHRAPVPGVLSPKRVVLTAWRAPGSPPPEQST